MRILFYVLVKEEEQHQKILFYYSTYLRCIQFCFRKKFSLSPPSQDTHMQTYAAQTKIHKKFMKEDEEFVQAKNYSIEY